MDREICRAITFLNYHIPPVLDGKKNDGENKHSYITFGFFDGMLTERLAVCYKEEELKSLWRYNIRRGDKRLGQYSCQNIFCFSKDEWNQCSDDLFWSDATNREYPLTFIVFLQLREYVDGADAMEQQCRIFNETAHNKMGDAGLCYTYDTIDKNDFVVCLKCRRYRTAVEVIKSLHGTGKEILYSYSVFSVARTVLEELQDERYHCVFEEEIYSICLKGITNSYDLRNSVTLDQKYSEFCKKLVDKLYEGQGDDEKDFKIYDILGDDDFRLIARHVKLGKLLQQFAPGGLLCYEEWTFQFYFFSSNMVLNTRTAGDLDSIRPEYIDESSTAMRRAFQSPLCDQMEKRMKRISEIVSDKVCAKDPSGECDERQIDERVITFCHAIWQLLQSLKPLETAPAKKYDFWSLYIPFSVFADILEEKLDAAGDKNATEEERDFVCNEEIYNFIHKISMTLHGTLRTDIQFFQIRDFNVIVHYAPAKLRAFYSFWVLRLTDYYNEFNEDGKKNEYSFILSPGMYQQTGVSELYTNYVENKRLMLIKVPERHLYETRWFPVILAHEVSHFVGYASRRRVARHLACLKVCARVLFLEMNYYRYCSSRPEQQPIKEQGIKELKLYEEIVRSLEREEYRVRITSSLYPHEFHSKNSMKIIKKTFRNGNGGFTDKIIAEDSERMNDFLKKGKNIEEASFGQKTRELQKMLESSNREYKELLTLNQKFEFELLPQLLELLIYICKEAYADLIAVLTLGLSPEEYLYSFTKGECNIKGDRIEEEKAVLLILRAGFAMQAVMSAVRDKPACLTEEFCLAWTGDVLVDLIKRLDRNETEWKIAVDIYGHIKGIRDCNAEIHNYMPMYNYGTGWFSNHMADFFNDEAVCGSLLGYFEECARVYVAILSANDRPAKMRQKLLDTYRRVSKESVISMSQEIENFLAEFEAERKGGVNGTGE